MALMKTKIGKLIEQTNYLNSNLTFGENDVMGMTIDKRIIPTKADVKDAELSKYLVVNENEFIYNPRTHGKKIGLGFNNLGRKFIISWNNISFKVKDSNEVLPLYLYMFFNRSEWDRKSCFDSWGSSTEVFSWDSLCDMDIELPDLSTQEKFVKVYLSMLENQKNYERELEDLKLVCDGYIEELREKYKLESLGPYISRVDVRNGKEGTKNVKGVSTSKEFRDTTSKVNKDELANYKVVKPRQITFVQTTHNEKVFCNAFNNTDEDIVVTSVNEVFECDETKLLPEYLCMIFNRNEFDRYARFHSWGSARETFTWNDLIQVKIARPDITIQKAVVNIFNAYKLRKEINEKLKQQIKDICPILIKGSIEEAREA